MWTKQYNCTAMKEEIWNETAELNRSNNKSNVKRKSIVALQLKKKCEMKHYSYYITMIKEKWNKTAQLGYIFSWQVRKTAKLCYKNRTYVKWNNTISFLQCSRNRHTVQFYRLCRHKMWPRLFSRKRKNLSWLPHRVQAFTRSRSKSRETRKWHFEKEAEKKVFVYFR